MRNIAFTSLIAAGSSNGSRASNGGGAATSPGMQGKAAAGALDCGGTMAVWVNLRTKVYHQTGDPIYGKRKHGEYLSPAQAREQGFRPAGGRHHRRRAEGSEPTSDPST